MQGVFIRISNLRMDQTVRMIWILFGDACQKFSHAAPQLLSSVAVSQFEFGVACNSYINTMLNILMSRCNPAESVREQSIRRQRIP